MRLFISITILLFFSCNQNDCDEFKVNEIRLKKIVKDYFPYHAGEKIKFTRFIDTAMVGKIEFTIDTFSYKVGKGDYTNCNGLDFQIEEIENFNYTFTNQTEPGNNWTLNLDSYNGSNFSFLIYGNIFNFYSFEDAIINGNPSYAVDSIILNNKNYGPGFCTNPNNSLRVYFNSTYGILKFTNTSKKEEIIFTE